MRNKLININEKIKTKSYNSDSSLQGRFTRNYLLLVKESKTTGVRKVLFLIKKSDYKSPGIAYGIVKKKYHQFHEEINQQRYRIFPLDIMNQEELLREGLATEDSLEMRELILN